MISCFFKEVVTYLNYNTMNEELLAVYKSLKIHHNIIYGCKDTVMTDHKNLTNDTTSHSSQCVLRPRLAIDQEHHAKLVYYEGYLMRKPIVNQQ